MSSLFKTHTIPSESNPAVVTKVLTDEERSQYDYRARIKEIKAEIAVLMAEKKRLHKMTMYGGHARPNKRNYLYALKLECGKYYVGFSTDVEKRYKKHCKGKGAVWTKKYKPVEILEVRELKPHELERIAFLEDDMTIEYAMKFGSEHVRGGGFCQILHPHWPDVVIQNEINH